jgi:hypothetical protein
MALVDVAGSAASLSAWASEQKVNGATLNDMDSKMWTGVCGQEFFCLCPEGTIGLSLGFQPQEKFLRRFALKGR